MNIILGIVTGVLIILIFAYIIPRLLSGLPKTNKDENSEDISWRNFDEFDGK